MVEVVRSARRRRTASARVVRGRVVVRVPARTSTDEEAELVATLVARLRGRALAPPPPVDGLPDRVPRRSTERTGGGRGDRWLVARADEVGTRWLDGLRATHVTWSSRMQTRWASCSVASGRIRISDRLADAPEAVLDNVLLHELAHLRVQGHGPDFAAIMARDPRSAAVDQWLDRRTALEVADVLEREGLLHDVA